MGLGETLRQARREAGLTQRQLSQGIVTRNMLSQIENGTARPSMDTLAALAARLGKPMGFFLDPDAPAPNQAALLAAWDHWEKKEYPQAAEALAGFTPPDALLGREYALLTCLVNLALGEAALAQGRDTLALSHLAQAALEEENAPCAQYLRTRRLLLQGALDPKALQALPNADALLLGKGEGALLAGDTRRCRALLEATERRPQKWYLLMGRCALAECRWQEAADCLRQAQKAYPSQALPGLERAYRELGDYRRAYECACAQRKE